MSFEADCICLYDCRLDPPPGIQSVTTGALSFVWRNDAETVSFCVAPSRTLLPRLSDDLL